jgi:hypothetical protein
MCNLICGDEVIIDLTRAMSEAQRMADGEIPLNLGYLNELVDEPSVIISVEVYCANCSGVLEWANCPECALVERDNCPLCESEGGWYECGECDE